MKKNIFSVLLVSAFFNVTVYAEFDNFTNWGNGPITPSAQGSAQGDAWANISWFEVARNNGKPSSSSAPLVEDEFKTLESDDSVVVVSSSVEFPQRLKPKQTIQISIGPKIPTAGASIKFAIVSDKLKRNEFMTYRFENAERPLCIKLNGRKIYHRNITDGRLEQEIFLPFIYFQETDNVLEISNDGNFILAFDYFRMQPIYEGQKTFISFAPSKGVHKRLLSDLPIELLELSLPNISLTNVTKLGNAQAPIDYQSSYMAMSEIHSLGYLQDKKYGEEFNTWASEITYILKNKKMPYVRIKGDLTQINENTAMWFLTRFGCVVYGWICDDERSAEVLSKYIDNVNIVALDVCDADRVKTAANVQTPYCRTYPAPVTVKGGRQDRLYGDYLQHYLAIGKNYSPSFLSFLTPLMPLKHHQAIIDNGEDTMIALLQVLMHGGKGAIIDPGEKGENFIVEGKQQPIWQMYKKIFELSAGEGKILPMTLSLEDSQSLAPLEDTYYVATKNSDEELTVVVFSTRADYGRDANIVVPVYWTGGATITQQDFQIDEIGQSVPTPSKPKKRNIRVLAPQRQKGVDIGPFKGIVSLEYKTSGLSIINIKRYKSREAIEEQPQVESTEAESRGKLERAQTFDCLPNQWRYVPIVASTNLTDFVEFVDTRILTTGPRGTGVKSAGPSEHKEIQCVSAPETFDSKGKRFVMLNAPIWDDNSIFVEFSGAKHKQRPNYFFNLGLENYLKGAKGFGFFINVSPIVGSISERLNTSTKPVTFAIASSSNNRVLFDVELDTPTFVYIPFSSVVGVMNDPSLVLLAMDPEEMRDIRAEINYLSAVYDLETTEPKLAVRYDMYEKALYVLVEGDTGKPLNVNFRLKDKFNLTKASPILPHGFTKLTLNVDVERNRYGIVIDKMPNNDGSRGNASKYFPSIVGDAPAGKSRVLIKFTAERF